MAVDLKQELSRPLALILAALAALGWVLLGLSSWSTASVQKTQRMQIMEAAEKNERLSTELTKQLAMSGAIGDLERRVLETREELTRMTQARADVQAELAGAQRRLTTTRRDVTEADRNLALQNQRIADLQTNSVESAGTAPETEPSGGGRVSRGRRRGSWGRRGRVSRSFSIMTRRTR